MPDRLFELPGPPATLGLPPIRRASSRGTESTGRGEITALIELSFEEDDDVATCVMTSRDLPAFEPRGDSMAVSAPPSSSARRRAAAAFQIALGCLAIIACLAGVVRAFEAPKERVKLLVKRAHRLSLDPVLAGIRTGSTPAEASRAETDIPVISLDDLPELASKPKPKQVTAWAWKHRFHRSVVQRPLPEAYKGAQRAKRARRQ